MPPSGFEPAIPGSKRLQDHALAHAAIGIGIYKITFINFTTNFTCFPNYQRFFNICNNKKVKWSRYRPGVAQRVGRGIPLLFHDRGTRRGWVVSSTPRPHYTPGKDLLPILQEAGWSPGPVWTGGKSRPNRDLIPDRPARSQSLYRLSYRVHLTFLIFRITCNVAPEKKWINQLNRLCEKWRSITYSQAGR